MPKILISEMDRTSPGAANDYSNYAVLLAGFASKPTAVPGSVFECTSAAKFKEAVGLVAPRISDNLNGVGTVYYHYGNQMAYELLNLGYKVIYKVISDVNDLVDETFWEEFKDKANYDFRFISHGLLSSSEPTIEQYESTRQLDNVTDAIRALDKIINDAQEMVKGRGADAQVELAYLQNALYQKAVFKFIAPEESDETYPVYLEFKSMLEEAKAEDLSKHAGLLVFNDDTKAKSNSDYYDNFADARQGTVAEEKHLKDNLANIKITSATINKVNALIANLAAYTTDGLQTIDGRGDCIALIELDERSYTDPNYSSDSASKTAEHNIIAAINKLTMINEQNGTYCAMTVPSVVYNMSIDENKPNEFENNCKLPGAFHYLACFANSLNSGFAEWYAVAGYTRGVASLTIDHTTVKLGEVAINALEPRNKMNDASPRFACNVIAHFRGSYYLWGNRTAFKLYEENHQKYGDLTASSFLNIRQLCATIKKQLYVACRRYTFDPNSDTLWVNFVNAIKPTLELMKADQGIRDYKIQKVYDANPKKATLKAKIRIIPIEAVEDFNLEVSLEDSFGETTAVVTE